MTIPFYCEDYPEDFVPEPEENETEPNSQDEQIQRLEIFDAPRRASTFFSATNNKSNENLR